MARWQPFDVVGGAYSDDTRPWTVQDTVNYLIVNAERPGGRSNKMLRGVPGLVTLSASMPESSVRGLYVAEGRLFAVVGTTLYRIATDGSATSLGTIPGVGRCVFTHNQVSGGNQVVIGNGQSGYVFSTTDDTLTQITDEGFPGFRSVDFADQYIIGVEPFGRYWFHSDLADATSYSTLDRAEAEKAPDRIQQAIATGSDILVLGERTGQFFYNTGEATGTFQNRSGAEMDVGAGSPYTACRLDNTVYWLGNDGSVYRLNGYVPQRISTHALEQAISRCTLADAYAFTFEDNGHKCYLLTFPDGQTWCFDAATQEWTRRESYGFDRWRVSALVKWGRHWIAGDFINGKLYQLDWRVQSEADEPLERRRITGVLHDDQNRMIVNAVEFVFDTGMDEDSPPLPVPIMTPLSISGDLPNGYVGDSGSGSYTVTGGATPYGTVSVTSGTEPPGLTLNANGTYTYTYTTAGTYTWTVGGVDAAGNPFSVNDSAQVLAGEWWVTNYNAGVGAIEDDLYISQNPLSFGAAVARSPFVQPEYGPKSGGVGVVLVGGDSTSIERITDTDPGGGVATTVIDVGITIRHIRTFDNATIILPKSGTGYRYSTDNGATWQVGAFPGSLRVEDISRLSNGRWLGLASGIGGGFYYSDEDVPTLAAHWTYAAASDVGGGGHASGYIATTGTSAISFSTTNCKRTTDGLNWSAVGTLGDADLSDGTSISGVYVCQLKQRGSIYRSTDDGLTFAEVFLSGVQTTDAVQRLEVGGGAVVACTSGSKMWVSTNNGVSWTESTTPGTNGKRAAYIVRAS